MNPFKKSLSFVFLTAALTFGLAGCGHDSTNSTEPPPNKCGSCARYEQCLSSGLCGINPNSSWLLAVQNAKIASTTPSGEAWDAFGGAPDPFVVLDGQRTRTVQDSFTPTWAEGLNYTAATLLLQGVNVQVLDEDLAQSDLIAGPSQVVFRESDLRSGLVTLKNFSQALSLTFSLTPQ